MRIPLVVEVHGDRQADLAEVAFAGHIAGGVPRLCERGEEQADQDGDDRDDHQQLDQREGPRPPTTRSDPFACHTTALLADTVRAMPRVPSPFQVTSASIACPELKSDSTSTG